MLSHSGGFLDVRSSPDEITCLPFKVAADSCQGSQTRVLVPRVSCSIIRPTSLNIPLDCAVDAPLT